ncbi:MAG: HypC/HybG/HupF family hydrogenase formation chaperone [Candidatus Paceibacterota bacterium]|jgi:hydrogenase expression/formation protein HypC|nr:HypC/HybG/HupF family hydrogenase formation chaperone [Candidatus Paceibacterota bacterium]
MCLSIPGKIVAIEGNEPFRTAKVNFGGAIKGDISLLFCPGAKVDDYCLTHAGNALEIIDEALALETITLLQSVRR